MTRRKTQKHKARRDKEPQDVLKRPWTAFVRCTPDPRDPECEIYQNSRYQVHLRRLKAQDGGPDLIHLSYKRLDQRIWIPYRDKQRMKNELVHPECEGVELLPAHSREVDLSNHFHAWVVADRAFRFPFGFPNRFVSDVSIEGTAQEPWLADERPADCLSEAEVQALVQTYQLLSDRSLIQQ